MLPNVSLYFVSVSRMSSPIELCSRIHDPGEMGLGGDGGPINFDPFFK